MRRANTNLRGLAQAPHRDNSSQIFLSAPGIAARTGSESPPPCSKEAPPMVTRNAFLGATANTSRASVINPGGLTTWVVTPAPLSSARTGCTRICPGGMLIDASMNTARLARLRSSACSGNHWCEHTIFVSASRIAPYNRRARYSATPSSPRNAFPHASTIDVTFHL